MGLGSGVGATSLTIGVCEDGIASVGVAYDTKSPEGRKNVVCYEGRAVSRLRGGKDMGVRG